MYIMYANIWQWHTCTWQGLNFHKSTQPLKLSFSEFNRNRIRKQQKFWRCNWYCGRHYRSNSCYYLHLLRVCIQKETSHEGTTTRFCSTTNDCTKSSSTPTSRLWTTPSARLCTSSSTTWLWATPSARVWTPSTARLSLSSTSILQSGYRDSLPTTR